MPYDDDNDRSTLSTTSTSVYIPVTIDKQPLTWDGNDASILGLLYEIGRYFNPFPVPGNGPGSLMVAIGPYGPG